MAQINVREVVLLAAASQTTNGTGSDINLPQGFTAAIVTLNVSSVTGTTPTLNFYVQNKLPQVAAADLTGGFPTGTAIYDDFLAFAQVTTTGNRVFRIVGGSNVEAAAANGALSAGSARNGPIGGTWNVKFTIGGTSPVFNFSAVVELIP